MNARIGQGSKGNSGVVREVLVGAGEPGVERSDVAQTEPDLPILSPGVASVRGCPGVAACVGPCRLILARGWFPAERPRSGVSATCGACHRSRPSPQAGPSARDESARLPPLQLAKQVKPLRWSSSRTGLIGVALPIAASSPGGHPRLLVRRVPQVTQLFGPYERVALD